MMDDVAATPWPPANISPSAYTPHAQVMNAGPPVDPPFLGIHRAVRHPGIIVSERPETAYLVRDGDEPPRAYRRIEEKKTVKIQRNGEHWGHVLFCVALERDETTRDEAVFLEPEEGRHKLMAVKKVRKSVVDRYLACGGSENPYRENAVLQLIGDGRHVLKCIETLQDDRYIYVVTPYCSGGDLWGCIPWSVSGLPERTARLRFREMLENLNYLQSRGMCHRDLSPENVMVDGNDRCVVIDLGMCLRVPHLADGRTRLLIRPQGRCGKGPYMSPEVYANSGPFDGCTVDLWSTAVILYSMLTGLRLYDIPRNVDQRYMYFVIAGGIRNDTISRGIVETVERHFGINSLGPPRCRGLVEGARAHLSLSPDVRDLLQSMLQPHPANRLTLSQVMGHPWVMNDGLLGE